ALVLATGSNREQAEAVADHLGLFSAVIASDAERNLTGAQKLDAIRAHHPQSFAYAGNARADWPIWQRADSAVTVGAPPRIVKRLRARGQLEHDIPARRDPTALWRAMRPRQWLKNLLVFLPALASANTVGPSAWLACAIAFLAFSLCASAVYLVNDLIDIDADRA